ncbi:DNA-binding transcriptional ArsR family regulator [Nakamurella sp. UYEF19]|uniref:winged helix-turn-helix domain-containing protein n=1 Tax=Nakamurella sp. UYEF19 TaxID=1756392 RepID=UPI003399EA1F
MAESSTSGTNPDDATADDATADDATADDATAGVPNAGDSSTVALPPGTRIWDRAGVRLRDAKGLRAFAHPLRVALITALRVHGPLTATRAAALVDDSPSNCSFHLRTLASFGLIEEIPGTDARQRLWQVVRGGISFDPDDNAESRVAAKSAAQVFHAHTTKNLEQWIDREPDAPKAWQDAWFDSTWTIAVTAPELLEMTRAIDEIIRPFVERRRSRADLDDEVPVSVTAFAFPHVMPGHAEPTPPTPPTPSTPPAPPTR